MPLIYKLVPGALWSLAQIDGVFHGAPVDLADGYIHFSTKDQVAETAFRHFRAREGVVLVSVDSEMLGEALKFEPSRGGDLFPHLYGPLNLEHVVSVSPLPMDVDGRHNFDGLLS